MTRLDCSVVNCTYNKDDSCCKDNIHVGGKNAKVVDETSCESFRERKYDGASNADSIPSKPTEISCDAESTPAAARIRSVQLSIANVN